MEVETTTVKLGIKSLKVASKFAGPVATLSYGADIYTDYQNYDGNNRTAAMTMTTIGTGLAIGGGAVLAVAGAPAVAVVAGGAAIAVGVGLGVDWLKDTLLEKKK